MISKIKKRYGYIIAAILIILADQFSKLLIRSNYSTFDQDEIIKGFFRIVFVKNDGAVWGLFSGHGNPLVTLLLTAAAIAALIVVIFLFLKSKNLSRLEMLSLTFIVGGAIGNIIDRISLGYVVDFIEIYIKKYRWPAFNIADSFISIGMILLIFSILSLKKKNIDSEGE